MPIPSTKENEDKSDFMARCMGDSTMNKEYPENKQRYAVCMGKATEGLSLIEEVDLLYREGNYWMVSNKSESDEKAGYPPNCNEGYVEKDGKCVRVE